MSCLRQILVCLVMHNEHIFLGGLFELRVGPCTQGYSSSISFPQLLVVKDVMMTDYTVVFLYISV